MPQRTPKISVAEIIALRKGGFTIDDIAAKADVPRTTLGGWLKKWEVEPEEPVIQRSKMTDEWAATLNEMYWERQMSLSEMEKELGIGSSTIHDNLRRCGIPLRDRKEAINLAFEKHPEMRKREWMKGRKLDTTKAWQASVVARQERAKKKARNAQKAAAKRAKKAREETQQLSSAHHSSETSE